MVSVRTCFGSESAFASGSTKGQRFRFTVFFGFFRVERSPDGGGGVASMARTISSKLPEISGTVVSA